MASSAPAPRLTFFCELEPERLRAFLEDGQVIASLQRLGAAVSLGLLDLGPERADVVGRLNAAGVPVTACVLLPREQGYFQHLDNVDATTARFEALCEWTVRHGLRWDGLGFSLQGCVEAGHLSRLEALDWSAGVEVDPRPGRRVELVRRVYRGAVRAAGRIEHSARGLATRVLG